MATAHYRGWMWAIAAGVVVAAHALVATALLVTWTPEVQRAASAPLTVTLAMQTTTPSVPPARPVERPRLPATKPAVTASKPEVAVAHQQPTQLVPTTTPPETSQQVSSVPPTTKPQTDSSEQTSRVRNVWYGQVLALLQKQKRYPRLALLRSEQGVVKVRFVLDRGGRLLSVELEKSSGYQALDQEALALVRRVSPFPAPPVSVTGNHISLEVPIAFQVTQ